MKNKLNSRQKKFLDVYLENPMLPLAKVARALAIPPNTVYRWKQQNLNGFNDVIEEELNNRWTEAKLMASETMFSLAREGDFKAAKYILDYHGFKPVDKVEQKIEQTTIEVNISED